MEKKAEERVKKPARTVNAERIKELEDRISKTKYNKKTQHAIGLYKAQLAQLKEKQTTAGKGKGKAEGYSVRRSGDGTAILVGFPSVGKSTLLNAITNANSEIGSYAFTTLTVIPGLMKYKFAKIQILDVPGIVHGAASGKGRGREVLSTMMSADLIIFLVDVTHPEHMDAIAKEVYDAHVRVNQGKPDVKIVKKPKGGISIGSTVKLTKINKTTIRDMLKTFRINNADVVVRTDITPDQLIDVVKGNKRYIPAITVLSKIDLVTASKLEKIKKKTSPDVCVSVQDGIGISKLKDAIFNKMRLIRVFLKEPGKEADMKEPMIMWKGCTLKDLCLKLHKDFITRYRFARIWGKGVKFDGQKILKLGHVIRDNDIIELRID